MNMADTPHPPGNALAATSSVEYENGRFVVYLDVIFPEGAVRRRIQAYRSVEQARTAARLFERSADRDPRGRRP